MNQRKPNIILKLSDCKIQLNFIFETILVVDLVQEWLGKRSNHRFLIIVDNILKELIDKLNLKVSEIKSCVIIAIVLIC